MPGGFHSPIDITIPSEIRLLPSPQLGTFLEGSEMIENYFDIPNGHVEAVKPKGRENFDFWGMMPCELKFHILRYMTHAELIKASRVSKAWHETCFDGQLWQTIDAWDYYQMISSQQLKRIVRRAGPFVKTLNLRGCRQLEEEWARGFIDVCENLESVNLQGCGIQRAGLRNLFTRNTRLAHLDVQGIQAVNNSVCKVLANSCPDLEFLDVSFCNSVSAKGILKVVESCHKLRTLRAGEVGGFDEETMLSMFEVNSLQRLDLRECKSVTDEVFKALIQGKSGEIDVLTGRVIVPPRKLVHLDLSGCSSLTDRALETLVDNVPDLKFLRLYKCDLLTDALFKNLLPTIPKLEVLNVEECHLLTNATLQELAQSPCADNLKYLTISDCENLGDGGMLPVLKACSNLEGLSMDNTRIGDLTLVEAASIMKKKAWKVPRSNGLPFIGMKMEVFDCQNVTWTGVRAVLARNAEAKRPSNCQRGIISLHCFYGWQQMVNEHEKRVLGGDFTAASRLERKWAEYMMSCEEAGLQGSGFRRRQRRRRDAFMQADLEEGGTGLTVGRRRARSGGCVVM